MSDDINFTKAETNSYARIDDDKYAKIATIVSSSKGTPTLIGPYEWSYAETHSYVKLDPKDIDIEVPSGVTDIYAKVLFLVKGETPGGSQGSSSTSFDEKDPIFSAVSSQFALANEIPTKTSDLNNDSKFLTQNELSSFYSKTEVDELLNELRQEFNRKIITEIETKLSSGTEMSDRSINDENNNLELSDRINEEEKIIYNPRNYTN